MRFESVTYVVYGSTYVTFTDLDVGKGTLQIFSPWGSFAAFWGTLDQPIIEFLIEADRDMVEANLERYLFNAKKSGIASLRNFMDQAWDQVVAIVESDLNEKSRRS